MTFWDERYSIEDYVYGIEPNYFFKSQIDLFPPGKLLLPGEGEGRNAVYAAKNGWEVTAFDSSVEGQKKALKLAKLNNCTINYMIASYDDFEFDYEIQFDTIGLIYTHMPSTLRAVIHNKLLNLLIPGGHVILEGFAKNQLGRNTGGPKDVSMLFSEEELRSDFSSLSLLHVEQSDVQLQEGKYHIGLASIIRLFGTK